MVLSSGAEHKLSVPPHLGDAHKLSAIERKISQLTTDELKTRLSLLEDVERKLTATPLDVDGSLREGSAANSNRKRGMIASAHPAFRHRRSAVAIDSLSPDQSNDPKWKKYLKLVLPHVGLALICILYTFAGATIFYLLERPHEMMMRKEGMETISRTKSDTMENIWMLAERAKDQMSYEEWAEMAEAQIDNFTRVLFEWSEQIPFNNSSLHWTFPAAVFFAASTVTTIGYGNLVPATQEGRIVCVIFGLFGIPLMLVTIADIGKFLGDGFLVLYGKYRQLRRSMRRSNSADLKAQELESDMELDFDHDPESVPVTWVLAVIIGYTSLGGVLLRKWEDWTFGQSFYFSFITMSTVGFGDFVPVREDYYAVTLLYILLGLAIATMSVDLVGSQYIKKIHYFGRKIRTVQMALRTVGDMMRYTAALRKRYGLSEKELDQLPLDPELEKLLRAPLAFIPADIHRIYYIDQRTDTSMTSVGRSSLAHLKDIDDFIEHIDHV